MLIHLYKYRAHKLVTPLGKKKTNSKISLLIVKICRRNFFIFNWFLLRWVKFVVGLGPPAVKWGGQNTTKKNRWKLGVYIVNECHDVISFGIWQNQRPMSSLVICFLFFRISYRLYLAIEPWKRVWENSLIKVLLPESNFTVKIVERRLHKFHLHAK